MAKPYSNDLRARVVDAVAEGATREEAADRHEVSLSSVGRFLRLKRDTGSVSPAKFGGHKPYALAAYRKLSKGAVQYLSTFPDTIPISTSKCSPSSKPFSARLLPTP
jgi:hypothetical protein